MVDISKTATASHQAASASFQGIWRGVQRSVHNVAQQMGFVGDSYVRSANVASGPASPFARAQPPKGPAPWQSFIPEAPYWNDRRTWLAGGGLAALGGFIGVGIAGGPIGLAVVAGVIAGVALALWIHAGLKKPTDGLQRAFSTGEPLVESVDDTPAAQPSKAQSAAADATDAAPTPAKAAEAKPASTPPEDTASASSTTTAFAEEPAAPDTAPDETAEAAPPPAADSPTTPVAARRSRVAMLSEYVYQAMRPLHDPLTWAISTPEMRLEWLQQQVIVERSADEQPALTPGALRREALRRLERGDCPRWAERFDRGVEAVGHAARVTHSGLNKAASRAGWAGSGLYGAGVRTAAAFGLGGSHPATPAKKDMEDEDITWYDAAESIDEEPLTDPEDAATP